MRGLRASAVAVLACAVPIASDTAAARVEAETGDRAAWHLIFTSNRDGDYDVFAGSVDGRVAALTRNSVDDARSADGGVVISPNGRWLVVERSGRGLLDPAILVSADGLRERSKIGVMPTLFSPTGRLLALTLQNARTELSRIVLLDLATGHRRSLGTGVPGAFSPDGRKLLFWDDRHGDQPGLIELRTGARWLLGREARPLQELVGWSPSSRRIAFVTEREDGDDSIQTLYVADVTRPTVSTHVVVSGEKLEEIQWLPHDRLGYERSFSMPDGEFHSEVGNVNADGRDRFILDDADRRSTVKWSPDGRLAAFIASHDDLETEELVVVGRAPSYRRVVLRMSFLSNVNWSPRSGSIAVEVAGGVAVVDLEDRRTTRLKTGSQVGELQWAPDERNIAIDGGDTVALGTLPSGRVMPLFTGGGVRVIGWMRGPLPPDAPRAARPPAPETASARELRSRGKVVEISADGLWSAAILGASPLDCDHVVAWNPSTAKLVRFDVPSTVGCGDSFAYSYGLRVAGTRVTYNDFFCGNSCYASSTIADVRRPGRASTGAEEDVGQPDRPPGHPRQPREIRRGVSMSLSADAIQLRRLADGRARTIRPPGGAVDAELEANGLFYAYNRRGSFPGRVVFVPFAELLAPR
jgi:Tol biopolymer transport system component